MSGIIVAVSLAILGLLAVGCNTIHGVGKNIEKGGEAIPRSVK